MTDLRINYNEEMVGANHPTKQDTLNRLALEEHHTDGVHKYGAGWLRGLAVRYKDADGVTVTPGEIAIHDGESPKTYRLDEQTDKIHGLTGGPKTAYVYVQPAGSGRVLSASDISVSDAPPVLDAAKHGWYHPTEPSRRFVGSFAMDGSNDVLPFDRDASGTRSDFRSTYTTVNNMPGDGDWHSLNLGAFVPHIDGAVAFIRVSDVYDSASSGTAVRKGGVNGTGHALTQVTVSGPYAQVRSSVQVNADGEASYQHPVGGRASIYIQGYQEPR